MDYYNETIIGIVEISNENYSLLSDLIERELIRLKYKIHQIENTVFTDKKEFDREILSANYEFDKLIKFRDLIDTQCTSSSQ